MRLEDLEAFLAVAENRSFSVAAGTLHITQPAVSKRVMRLESLLETRLFDRVGKRIYLTDGGELLLPRAQDLLAGFADTRRALGNLDGRIAGRLKLATSHHVGLHRLAPVLKAFSQAHPEVRLDIRFEDSEAAHELVRHAERELAVVTLNPEGDVELTCVPLWDDPLCFVVAHDHPLAGTSRLELAALARHPVILPGPGTYTGRIVAELFDRKGIALQPVLSTNYLETISMLVATGLGWSVLPQSMRTGALVSLSTNAPPIGRTLGSVVNPRRTLSNAARAFLRVLQEFSTQPHPGS